MKNNKLKIFIIDTDYIEYLYRFDSNVMFNKDNAFTRPYVGIVLNINGFYLFAPLTHNGTKWIGYDDHIVLDGGKLGAIKFNKMVPIPSYFLDCLIKEMIRFDYLNSQIKYIREYGKLIEKQYRLINNNSIREKIFKVANNVFIGKNIYSKSKFYCNIDTLLKASYIWTFKYKAILFLINKYKNVLQKNKIIL